MFPCRNSGIRAPAGLVSVVEELLDAELREEEPREELLEELREELEEDLVDEPEEDLEDDLEEDLEVLFFGVTVLTTVLPL